MSTKVLIVDDSPLIHMLLKKALEKHNYTICGDAKNGKEAVELFEQLSPEIVFMDINMPIMDGLEAARRIREKSQTVKIVMLSAIGDEEVMRKAKLIGISVFIQKPFDDYKIVSALSNI